LKSAARPVFLVGDRAFSAMSAIRQLAVLYDAKIVATPHGKGVISAYHPNFGGVIGFAGHSSAEKALADPAVDCVIAVGVTFGEWASPRPDGQLVDSRMIHVDSLARAFVDSHAGRMHVHGEVATIFLNLLRETNAERFSGPQGVVSIDEARAALQSDALSLAYAEVPATLTPSCELDSLSAFNSDQPLIKPQRLMHELSRQFAGRGRFLADSGNSVIWAIHYLNPLDRRMEDRRLFQDRRNSTRSDLPDRRSSGRRTTSGRLFHGSMEFAAMGWGIGAAVGLAAGDPDTPVVVLVGDGSLLMNGQEMTVALQHHLKVIFVVLNDGCIGTVKHGQRLSGAEQVGYELPAVDFAAMATAMGVSGIKVATLDDLLALDVDAICDQDGPTVIDVAIDPEEVPPMGARMKWLGK